MTFEPTAREVCVGVTVLQDFLAGEGLEVFSLSLTGVDRYPGVVMETVGMGTVDVLLNDVPGRNTVIWLVEISASFSIQK